MNEVASSDETKNPWPEIPPAPAPPPPPPPPPPPAPAED